MLGLIERIVRSYIFTSYHIELMKLRMKIRFRSRDFEHKFLDILYEEYLEKVLKRDIFPQSNQGFQSAVNKGENIFLKFRDANNGRLSGEDEQYLISKLKSKIGNWFVPFVLSVSDHFSENLMHSLLEKAIKVRDPSYNSCFINPALRVYRFQVYDYLIDRFNASTFEEKMGILRAFYWVGEFAVWRKKTGKVETDYRAKYKWNDRGYYESDYDLSEEVKLRFSAEMNRLHERKIETFLDHFKSTDNVKLKYYISLELPKTLEEYPLSLQGKASQLLADIKQTHYE